MLPSLPLSHFSLSLSHTHSLALSFSFTHSHSLSLPSCQNTRSLFTCRVLSVWVCYNVRRFEHNFFSELPRQTNSFKQDSMPVLASSLVAPLPVFWQQQPISQRQQRMLLFLPSHYLFSTTNSSSCDFIVSHFSWVKYIHAHCRCNKTVKDLQLLSLS